MQPDISILICTHNRAEILGQTLDGLAAIQIPTGTSLEVVVIANACTDDTERVVADKSASLPMPLRCVVEAAPGLSRARNRAMAESRGVILAFIDDDVWVETDWAKGLLEAYARDGADMVAGKVTLWWKAISPPTWLDDRVANLLNRRDLGAEIVELRNASDALGANFSFRRKVFESVGDFRLDLGRTGTDSNAAEETEYLERALLAGFRMFYAPRASLRHWVAPSRVSIEYFCRVSAGNARSRVMAKKKYGLPQALRTVAGHALLWGKSVLGEWRSRGNQKIWLYHRTRRITGRAGIAAALTRITAKRPPR